MPGEAAPFGERKAEVRDDPALLRAGGGSTWPLEVPCSPNLFVTVPKLEGGAAHQILRN